MNCVLWNYTVCLCLCRCRWRLRGHPETWLLRLQRLELQWVWELWWAVGQRDCFSRQQQKQGTIVWLTQSCVEAFMLILQNYIEAVCIISIPDGKDVIMFAHRHKFWFTFLWFSLLVFLFWSFISSLLCVVFFIVSDLQLGPKVIKWSCVLEFVLWTFHFKWNTAATMFDTWCRCFGSS